MIQRNIVRGALALLVVLLFSGASLAGDGRAGTDKKILYWQHPDGVSDFAPGPKRTSDGRDYVPVFEGQEADFKVLGPKKATTTAPKNRRILYYRNPMGLPDTSPVPKKDGMGMDYIAVYDDEAADGSSVKISLDRVQRSGVRTAAVEQRHIARVVRAPAIAKPDERQLRVVSLRTDGFIEKLYANETGRHVVAGEPLFRVFSPQLTNAQVDLRVASASGGTTTADRTGAVQQLKNYGVPDPVIEQMKVAKQPILMFDWPSPVGGYVMEKNVVEGQMAKAGDPLLRLAALDPVWIIADVAEQDRPLIETGATAHVTFRALPGKDFEGKVTFILHELDPRTRTSKVRIELPNPNHEIDHEMFASAEIAAKGSDVLALAVPSSAIIDTGKRTVVLLARGDGRFEPRSVKTGPRDDDYTEITDGLAVGDKVVISANFLIDAESNIRAALKAFNTESGADAAHGHEHAPEVPK